MQTSVTQSNQQMGCHMKKIPNMDEQIEWVITFYSSLVESLKSSMEQITLDIQQGIQRYPRDNLLILASDAASLFNAEMHLIRAKYSHGMRLSEIEPHFYNAVEDLAQTEQYNRGYTNTLWLTALGILLGANKEIFETISTKAMPFDDFLLDYLLRSTGINYPDRCCGFYKSKPYSSMQKIIELPPEDKDTATKMIETYLNKEWFNGHRDYQWHLAYKRRDYVGFWSFECAALVKILKLDETKIACPQYYPYGLIKC